MKATQHEVWVSIEFDSMNPHMIPCHTVEQAADLCRRINSHESLLAACQRAYDVEDSVTQGLERELRVGYFDMLKAALADAGKQ